MEVAELIKGIGKGIDVAGIGVIVGGILIATVAFVRYPRRSDETSDAYTRYRRGVGRAILLGLEFLVAADIIRTVAIEPTFYNVGVLAVIVLIRTFLSVELEMEITGRWPWQQPDDRRFENPGDRPRPVYAPDAGSAPARRDTT